MYQGTRWVLLKQKKNEVKNLMLGRAPLRQRLNLIAQISYIQFQAVLSFFIFIQYIVQILTIKRKAPQLHGGDPVKSARGFQVEN